MSKETIIHKIIKTENIIADLSDQPESEFMRQIKGLEDMSIPGLKIRLKTRLIVLENHLLNNQ